MNPAERGGLFLCAGAGAGAGADGVVVVTNQARRAGESVKRQLHRKLGRAWRGLPAEFDARVTVLTGEVPSVAVHTPLADAGGGLPGVTTLMKETVGVFDGLIDGDKAMVWAINGETDAGLGAARLADVGDAGKQVSQVEGHQRFGVGA